MLSSTGLGEGENSGWAMSVVDTFVNKNNNHNCNDQISSIYKSLYHYSKSIETKSKKIFNNLNKLAQNDLLLSSNKSTG